MLCVLLFGCLAWYVARNRGGRWAVVATPAGIGTVDGPGAVVVPWDAVRDVVADETTTYVRGMPNHEPHIAVHTESGAVRHDDAVDGALASLNRDFTDADLVVPVRALGVDPVLVLAALRHYLNHPDQRRRARGPAIPRADRPGRPRPRLSRLTPTRTRTWRWGQCPAPRSRGGPPANFGSCAHPLPRTAPRGRIEHTFEQEVVPGVVVGIHRCPASSSTVVGRSPGPVG